MQGPDGVLVQTVQKLRKGQELGGKSVSANCRSSDVVSVCLRSCRLICFPTQFLCNLQFSEYHSLRSYHGDPSVRAHSSRPRISRGKSITLVIDILRSSTYLSSFSRLRKVLRNPSQSLLPSSPLLLRATKVPTCLTSKLL